MKTVIKTQLHFLKSILLLTLAFCSFTHHSYARSGLISGKVMDQSQGAMVYATVVLQGMNKVTYTDMEGAFSFDHIDFGTYEIQVSVVGFATDRLVVEHSDSVTSLTIRLSEQLNQLPQMSVIGKRDRILSSVPGSAGYISKQELDRIQAVSGNEPFRRVAGVHAVEEEGVGLRANIGIRGLSPDKSRKVLVLEDGIPVALNPYGEPELYYTPAMDRMSGIEVVKGSGQIMYGPQTIGGVVNYITADPSEEQEVTIRLRGGEGQMFTGLFQYSNTFDGVGVLATYLRKQAEQVANVGYEIDDFTSKITFATGDRGRLGIKLGLYNELSNATYVGLTQSMFNNGGNDFTLLAPDDQLHVQRQSVSANHVWSFNDYLSLQTTAFAYGTTRNWIRQDYVYSNADGTFPGDWTGDFWGDTGIAGGAILLRNRNGHRNRQFAVGGLDQKVIWDYNLLGMNSKLIAGYRLLTETALEQRVNGTKPEARSGALVNDEIRTGNAVSAFIQNKNKITSRWEISYGVRMESYNFEREILRQGSIDTNFIANNTIMAIMPGIGTAFNINNNYQVFAGIHRGYAPPRVKDALDFSLVNPVLELRAEQSWNSEVGMRSMIRRGLYVEATAFYMDFENQIIPSSESVGGVGFGLTNAGRTIHSGFELAGSILTSEFIKSDLSAQIDMNYTYVNAVFAEDRFVESGAELININGNRTQYAPEHLLTTTLQLDYKKKAGIRGTYTYIGDQFGDDLNTIEPSANGRTGLIDAYGIIDLGLYSHFLDNRIIAQLSVKNLTNERYIVTRRPQGIRVGLPRFVSFSLEFRL